VNHEKDETPREPKGCRSLMQQMMDRMCATNDWTAMCQRMMASAGLTKDTDAPAATDASTSSGEQGRGAGHEAPGGCCGARPRSTPKPP
jgi:hypothetical protein